MLRLSQRSPKEFLPMRSSLRLRNPKAKDEIEPHLLNYLKLKPELAMELEARTLLGKFYVAEGRYAEAERADETRWGHPR